MSVGGYAQLKKGTVVDATVFSASDDSYNFHSQTYFSAVQIGSTGHVGFLAEGQCCSGSEPDGLSHKYHLAYCCANGVTIVGTLRAG